MVLSNLPREALEYKLGTYPPCPAPQSLSQSLFLSGTSALQSPNQARMCPVEMKPLSVAPPESHGGKMTTLGCGFLIAHISLPLAFHFLLTTSWITRGKSTFTSPLLLSLSTRVENFLAYCYRQREKALWLVWFTKSSYQNMFSGSQMT